MIIKRQLTEIEADNPHIRRYEEGDGIKWGLGRLNMGLIFDESFAVQIINRPFHLVR